MGKSKTTVWIDESSIIEKTLIEKITSQYITDVENIMWGTYKTKKNGK